MSYRIYPEPTHMNAPDAWMVWREIRDEDDERHDEMIAHGIPLRDALDEIEFDVKDS